MKLYFAANKTLDKDKMQIATSSPTTRALPSYTHESLFHSQHDETPYIIRIPFHFFFCHQIFFFVSKNQQYHAIRHFILYFLFVYIPFFFLLYYEQSWKMAIDNSAQHIFTF